jgi:hypothetical protein
MGTTLAAVPFRNGYMCFLGKTETSYKAGSSLTPNFLKIRNCKVSEVLPPKFDIATFGLRKTEGRWCEGV